MRQYEGYDVKWRIISPEEMTWSANNVIWQSWRRVQEFNDLSKTLLAIGGEIVVPPSTRARNGFYEYEMRRVVRRGKFYPGKPVCMRLGKPCQCHTNVSNLWRDGLPIHICTGYALSKDGRWRDHTWGVVHTRMPCGDIDIAEPGSVVETTESRVCYYGYLMGNIRAGKFVEANR